jgi:hypothetical protein
MPADSGGPELISYGNIPGFAEEMRHLGDCYMQGIEGHSRDADRAYKYYEAAAVHGCARQMPSRGHDVSACMLRASVCVRSYPFAAFHRCQESSLRVGKQYLDGPEPDDGKALFFLSVAAKVPPCIQF